MNRKKLLFILIPLVLALGIYFLLTSLGAPPLKVISSTPKDGENFVNTKTDVVFELNRTPSQKETPLLKIGVLPEEKIETHYLENKITISPATEFRPDTRYSFSVSFKEVGLYTLVFTTFPFTQAQIAEEGKKQSEADFVFGEKYKEFLAEYPWYVSLPIEKADYRIVYDFERASFRIRFKKEGVEEEKLIKEALDGLKKIGVPETIKYYTLGPND